MAKFNLPSQLDTSNPLSEVSQSNPIRWWLAKKTGDNEYTAVSYKWKCKDFMNEVVACYHTKESFSIYGFKTQPSMLDFDMDYLPLVVQISENEDTWTHNINSLNEWLLSQDLEPVETELCHGNYWVVRLPLVALQNTYFMSVYTLLIRCCNASMWNSFEQCKDVNCLDDKSLLLSLKIKLPKHFPLVLCDYFLYCGKYNNVKIGEQVKNKGIYTGTLHDCGLQGWGNSSTWNKMCLPEVEKEEELCAA